MELFYFTGEKQLDDFIRSAAAGRSGVFLQSWRWGEIARADGAEVLRVGVFGFGGQGGPDGQGGRMILAAATLLKKSLGGFYFYWYAPGGPIGDAIASRFLAAEIAKLNRRAVFWRLEPGLEPELKSELSPAFTYHRTIDRQPRQTLILDLAAEEDILLAAMHPKTRYNINLAAKKGVEIVEGGPGDVSELWRLLLLTSGRDNFRVHSLEHYKNLLAAGRTSRVGQPGQAGNGPFIRLFFARYQGKNIAAGLFSFFGDTVTYLHGASDNEFRNVMAPYLLQWSVIKAARARAYKHYDFYGIDEKKWPGVTRFKLGFGGRRVERPGTYDLVFRSVLYRFYGLLRKLRRLIG